MKEPEDLRFACNDARMRHAATIELVYSNGRESLGFLQLYIALSGGALSGGAVILFGENGLPSWLGWGLLGFAAPLIVGAVFVIAALWPTNIGLPGRKSDFWQWAMRDDVDAKTAYHAYLEALAEKQAATTALTQRASFWIYPAKIFGVAAPFVAVLVALAAAYIRL